MAAPDQRHKTLAHRQELEQAYQHLAPYIPEDHKSETRALASSLAMNRRLIETVNVFPELFHCSGFAVFGKATKDGKLYHGRVLDYMTTIGLQDAATTLLQWRQDAATTCYFLNRTCTTASCRLAFCVQARTWLHIASPLPGLLHAPKASSFLL